MKYLSIAACLLCVRLLLTLFLSRYCLAKRLAKTERLPIIDMHMHADPVSLGADGVPLSPPCHPMLCPPSPQGQARTAEEVLEPTLVALTS